MDIKNKDDLANYVTAMTISFILQSLITIIMLWLYQWWWGQIVLAFMTATTLICPLLIGFTIHDFANDYRNK